MTLGTEYNRSTVGAPFLRYCCQPWHGMIQFPRTQQQQYFKTVQSTAPSIVLSTWVVWKNLLRFICNISHHDGTYTNFINGHGIVITYMNTVSFIFPLPSVSSFLLPSQSTIAFGLPGASLPICLV